MKVYNPDHNEDLKPGLKRELVNFRRIRGFDPAAWVEAKTTLLNDYLGKAGLKGAVVGLSGGIDSSIVTALAVAASKKPGSPIQKITPVMIPAFTKGATGQNSALQRGKDVIAQYGLSEYVIDISEAHKALTAAVDKMVGSDGSDWARGQAIAHVRTSSLSYTMSRMVDIGVSSILLGTTNRSEGAYLGYVGKYSDGMVDLQVISDLFKSEVYDVARYLNLPQSTIDAIPTGDMYDNRADTQVFGAPYDFVELHHSWLELNDADKNAFRARLTADEQAQFDGMASNLENLHRYNNHKYLGNQPGSPAYHLDVQGSGVPKGWSAGIFDRPYPAVTNKTVFVGYFDLSQDFLHAVSNGNHNPVTVQERVITAVNDLYPATARILEPLLSGQESEALIAQTNLQNWVPVGDDGIASHFNPATDKPASWRLTTYSPEFARILFNRIAGRIPMTITVPEGSNVDAKQAKVWRAVGINPALRFIKYDPKGENKLVAHYDGPPNFDFLHGRTSLQSLVMYLTDSDPAHGGATRFITDPQAQVTAFARDLSDWKRPANHDEVLGKIEPKQGLAAIFPHRVLHDSEPLHKDGKTKIIVRTDIIYQPVRLP